MTALDMHEASVEVFPSGSRRLSRLLSKAQEYVELGRMSEQDLLEFRLAADMDPFRRQIQHAGDTAKTCVMRLAGRSIPSFEDCETSIEELKARVAKTDELLRSNPPEDLRDSAERIIKVNIRRRWITLDGRGYLVEYALPNFFFRVITAYVILRHNGLKIGELAYLVDCAQRREAKQ